MEYIQEVLASPSALEDNQLPNILECCKGLSCDEVISIVSVLPSVNDLRRKYKSFEDQSTEEERKKLKLSEYKIQVFLRLALGFIQNSEVDPLPHEETSCVISLLQDLSFLTDPVHNGIAVFMENILLGNFLPQLPQTLLEIYSELEISKPKKLKDLAVKKGKKKETVHYDDVTQNHDEGPRGSKRHKLENKDQDDSFHPKESAASFDAKLQTKPEVSPNFQPKTDDPSNVFSVQKISHKSLNHFNSGLANMKTLFGKQTVLHNNNNSPKTKRVHKK